MHDDRGQRDDLDRAQKRRERRALKAHSDDVALDRLDVNPAHARRPAALDPQARDAGADRHHEVHKHLAIDLVAQRPLHAEREKQGRARHDAEREAALELVPRGDEVGEQFHCVFCDVFML